MRKCSINNCGGKHYARSYCIRHYERWKRYKNPLGTSLKKCKNSNCNHKISRQDKEYCAICRHSQKRRIGLHAGTGQNNYRWNNGASEYLNHYTMKINRLIRLRDTKETCEICGGYGKEVHHRDGSKTNHSLKNLIVICRKCHLQYYHSKFKKIYGYTSSELAFKFGCSISKVYFLHKKNKLLPYIDKCR